MNPISIPKSNRKAIAHRLLLLLHLLAILATIGFIFGNSLLDEKQSGDVSSSVLETVEPIVRPVLDHVIKEPVTQDLLHYLVRKMAHFTEFALLATLCTLLLFQLCGAFPIAGIFPIMFATLFTAVIDEFIQSLTGRGSSVRDVLLDFGGAMTGMALTALGLYLVRLLLTSYRRSRTTQSPQKS